VADWRRAVFGVLARSGRPLAVLQVTCVLPALLLTLFLGRLSGTAGSVGTVLAAVAAAGLGALAQAASVYLAVEEAAGRPTAVSAALRFGWPLALPLLGWALLATVLIAVGLALLVLPGIYLAVVFGASLPGAVVVERAGLGRCVQLVTPRLVPAALRCAVALFVAAFYGALVGTLVSTLPGGVTGVAGTAVRYLAALPLAVAGTAFVLATYAELRRAEDGSTVRDLAAEMRR
jgi:hypothetical protein